MRSIRIALALFLVPLAGIAPGHPAAAAGTFTFYGGGYGHGVGMSQYGALGMAQDGWTHKQILTQFFTDTTVAQYDFPPLIRVGLVQGKKVFHLHARGGPVELGDPLLGELARAAARPSYKLDESSPARACLSPGENRGGRVPRA